MGLKLKVMAAAVATLAVVFSAQAAEAVATAKPAAPAAKKGSNADAAKASATSPATDAVASARTATALARYGDANKDPLALIVAARMLKQAGASESTAKKTSLPGKDAKDKPDAYTAEAMLDRAKALAAGRADIVALADDVAKGSSRGASSGPKFVRSVVSSRSIDTWRVVFNGGEPAAAAISGDGDSDLDLFVYDENNNLICSSTSGGDDELCRWNPRWTGTFFIRVRNPGIANQYQLRTN